MNENNDHFLMVQESLFYSQLLWDLMTSYNIGFRRIRCCFCVQRCLPWPTCRPILEHRSTTRGFKKINEVLQSTLHIVNTICSSILFPIWRGSLYRETIPMNLNWSVSSRFFIIWRCSLYEVLTIWRVDCNIIRKI